MPEKGLIVVVSAPSGAGKSTLCGLLVKTMPGNRCSISCTTRPPRPGERDGKDYFFVSERNFKKLLREGGFLEWARVHGHYYGTPRSFVEETTRSGRNILLNIDVQGAMEIRRQYPESVLVFVMTPTFDELEKRLRNRRQDSGETIRKRLRNARRELRYLPKYDYLVINDDVKQATRELRAIVTAEKRKLRRISIPDFNGGKHRA